MSERSILRARQVKALYQRELTAVHRDANLSDDEKAMQARLLWEQVTTQLDGLRREVEAATAELSPEQRADLAPPERPPEIDRAAARRERE